MKAIDLDKWIQLLKKINFHDLDEEMQYDITSDEDIEFVKYLTCYSDYIKIGGSNNLSINSSVKVTILGYPEGIVVYTNLIEFVRGQLTYCFKIIEHFYIKEEGISSLEKDSDKFLVNFKQLKNFICNIRNSCAYKDDALHNYIFIDDSGVLTVQMDFDTSTSNEIINYLKSIEGENSALVKFNDWFSEDKHRNQKGCCLANILRDYFKDKKEISIFDILSNLNELYIKLYRLFSLYLKSLEYGEFYRDQQKECNKFKQSVHTYLERSQFCAFVISLTGIFLSKSSTDLSTSPIYLFLCFAVILSLLVQGYDLFCLRNDFYKKIDTFKLLDSELSSRQFDINFIFKLSIICILIIVSSVPLFFFWFF